VIVLDTSVIYALLDAADHLHHKARDWYADLDDELVTTPLVLAEADHLATTRGGVHALRAFRDDVRRGAYRIDWWMNAPQESADIADMYDSLGIGLTDASLVALAARVETTDIATFDERHFRAVIPLAAGDAFRLLPLDAGP
jgi:predicted nucleic acid-binding protein